jgi:hypothetical protein
VWVVPPCWIPQSLGCFRRPKIFKFSSDHAEPLLGIASWPENHNYKVWWHLNNAYLYHNCDFWWECFSLSEILFFFNNMKNNGFRAHVCIEDE